MTWFIRCSKSSRDMMVALGQAERMGQELTILVYSDTVQLRVGLRKSELAFVR